jgi:hypothetical protein
MTLGRSYIGYLGFLVTDFLKSVFMHSKGAICLSKLLFKMGLFTVYSTAKPLPLGYPKKKGLVWLLVCHLCGVCSVLMAGRPIFHTLTLTEL